MKFSNLSKAGVGMYVVVIASILQVLGLNLGSERLTEAVLIAIDGAGAVLWIAGQILRKDLSWGLFRKQ